MNAVNPTNYAKVKVQELQNKLYLAAKKNPKRRFHALYDKLYREDLLWEAWRRVKTNRGSGGIDGITIDQIANEYGEKRFVQEIREQLISGTYHPLPARRKEIPKGDGKFRPLGIPAIRDRVVQMVTKMVIEPIFETDFKDFSYGFRPKRDTKGAIRHIRREVKKGVYFSRSYLRGKKFYIVVGFTSMYFSGGLIPSFMLMNWLGLYDHYLVYILPALFGGFWNVIIFNANYKAIPDSLFESAKMDGASEFRIFLQIVIPLSKPVLAALSVFTAVAVWNDYGTTLYFTQSSDLQTLQYVILRLIQSNRAVENMVSSVEGISLAVSQLLNNTDGQGLVTAQTIELAAMVIASIPMIVMYPFAQRFFVKGVLLGSVKG